MRTYKPLFYNFDPDDDWDELTKNLFSQTNQNGNYTQIIAVYATIYNYTIYYTYYYENGQPSNSVWRGITRKTNIRDIRNHVLNTNRSLQTYPAFRQSFDINDESNLNNRITEQIYKAIMVCDDDLSNVTETIELMML